MSTSDADLLQRWTAQRDPNAFQELVGRYSGLVFGASRRVLGNATDAEDVTQECFELVAGLRRPPAPYIGPWLHRVATNRSLDRLKMERRRRAREERFAAQTTRAHETPWTEISGQIDAIVASLPEKLRSPLVEHYYEGQTHDAVAERLGVSRQTVSYRIAKGIAAIREELQRRHLIVGAAALGTMMNQHLAEAAPAALTANLVKMAIAGPTAFTAASAGTTGLSGAFGLLTGGLIVSRILAIVAVTAGVLVAALMAMREITPPPLLTKSENGVVAEQLAAESAATAADDLQSSPEGDTLEPPATTVDSPEMPDIQDKSMSEPSQSFTISGSVVDTDGNPVSGAEIAAEGPSSASSASDSAGQFELTGLAEGAYIVSAQSPRYVAAVQPNVDAGTTVSLVLKPAATLEGIVVAADSGLPVTQFDLGYVHGGYSHLAVDMFPTMAAYTDRQGRFRIDNVDSGDITLVGTADGYAKSTMIVTGLSPGTATQGIVFPLERGRVAQGKVIGPDGRPVEHATVVYGASLNEEKRPVVTDANGRFYMNNVMPIGGRITAHHTEYAPGSVEIPTATTDIDNIVLQLGHGGVLRGRITMGVAPIAHARIRIKQHNFKWTGTETGDDGTFFIAGVVPGDAEILVRPADMPVKKVKALVEEGLETVVDVEYTEEVGGVEGQLSVNGEPTFGMIRLRAVDSLDHEFLESETDASGNFAFANVPAGRVLIAATIRDGDPADMSDRFNKFVPVDVIAGAVVRQNIDLKQNARISGTVTGERYNAYDRVYVLNGEADVPYPLTLHAYLELALLLVNQFNIDADGHYEGDGLEPGLYTIVASSFVEESPEALSSARMSEAVVVEIQSGDDKVLDFTLR